MAMDSSKLASGDGLLSPRNKEEDMTENLQSSPELESVTPQTIEDNETKLKERIAQCRDIIETLKLELTKEKSNLEKDSKITSNQNAVSSDGIQNKSNSHLLINDLYSSTMYSDSVDDKLHCDESLIEYEKQLQKYQNTLNMAHIEKKNAIRKQMLAKAYKLKLLEVENQCNIELLRVKQSLQCLEPLQMIASKWKTSTSDSTYDYSNFELIPRFPELHANSGMDFSSFIDDCDSKLTADKEQSGAKEEISSSE